jgi:very-short-patch-repair endonuclease
VDIDGSGGEPESPFEVDVLKEIRKMGYDAVPQVGQAGYRIDIGIRNPRSPGTFALAVECDGATYHSSRVARDRDRLRQEVLEGLNWKFHRIWSTSWFLDRAGEISRLQSAIEAALHPVKSKTKAPLVVEKPTQIEVTEVEEVSHSWAVDYVLHVPNVPRGLELDNDFSRPWISKMILEIVSKMKPVHEDVITQILRTAFSVKVMSERRRTNVTVCLAALKSKGDISKDKYGFWWPTNDSQIEVRSGTPSNPASVRKAAHVSPDEVRLAAYWLTADARSIEEPELIRKVAKVFGWQRVGGDIEHLIIREISKLRRDKYLIDKTGADGVNRFETSGVEAPNLD